ncbi:PREDICTED: DNA mismatch repair protein MLH3-like [Camelina sativa]|uniref:DNA mismatch repair protein MLH3-like n=1 Tax=Camelina sativa TaxID=90675 RepID=A0ABM1RLX1_CAMSA|nr:PREDICTED: DNA mismatch repair protein MLH3-like [Camelina sativa]
MLVRPRSNQILPFDQQVSIFVGVVSCSVKVVDDGSGVSRDDLVLLGKRYTTSKFHVLESASENFGFRGGALALASISDTLVTGNQDKSYWEA